MSDTTNEAIAALCELLRCNYDRTSQTAAATIEALQTEREANAKLTDEVERMAKERDAAPAELDRHKALAGDATADARQKGAQQERALVVAWLTAQSMLGDADGLTYALKCIASDIERGAHREGV